MLNQRSQNSALINVELLDAFNEVVDSDSKVSRLTVQEDENGTRWEIFLQLDGGIPIAISDSGSGLKTILFTCFRLRVTPPLAQLPLSQYVFLFEELENNIHPGLLRRLFALVRKLAVESNAHVFIATHSSVVLDLFSSDPMAQIIHVTKEDGTSNFRVIDHHDGLREILNDLDIRASDLLQSNGVIWVEGPSDRLYINRLINIVSNGELREGMNYQIVFYGGRLLSHVTTETENDELVNLLHVNRNAFVVVDRDSDPINSTKERVIAEVTGAGGGTWVTSRKEIECDLPSQSLSRLFPEITDTSIRSLESFDTFLERSPGDAIKLYRRSKAQFAKKLVGQISQDDVSSTPDLLEVIEGLCDRIRQWNQSSQNP